MAELVITRTTQVGTAGPIVVRIAGHTKVILQPGVGRFMLILGPLRGYLQDPLNGQSRY